MRGHADDPLMGPFVKWAGAKAKVEMLRVVAPRHSDPRSTLMLFGTPRSGTTWVAGLLASAPTSAMLFEPVHPQFVELAARLGVGWLPQVRSDEEWDEGKTFYNAIFSGLAINWWTAREVGFVDIARVRRWVVKEVRANGIMTWLAHNFDIPPPVLLVRHPCAVVASQRAHSEWKDQGPPPVPAWMPNAEARWNIVRSLETEEERLAASWAIDQLCPLFDPGSKPWHMIAFEDVVCDPVATLAPVFETWGEPVPQDLHLLASRPSTTSNPKASGGDNRLGAWRTQLDRAEARRVLDVVERLGVDLYGDDVMPNRSGAWR